MAATTNATTMAVGLMTMGHFANLAKALATPTPRSTPIRPPKTESVDGFEEELQEDVSAAGADGHADADLAGPLGDADEHDVHDADAADEERDDGDAEEEVAHELRPAARWPGRSLPASAS